MRLQTALKQVGTSLIIGLAMTNQVMAVDSSNDNLMCAAYMDIALEDLYPLRALPHAKAKEMLVGRFVRLGAVSVATKEPISDVVSAFIAARDVARISVIKNSNLNNMRLYTSDQIYNYAQNLDKKVTQHCIKGNVSIEKLMATYGKEYLSDKTIEASEEMKKQGES